MQIDYKKLQSIMPFGNLTYMGIAPDYEATILDFINDYRNSKILNKSLLTFIVCHEEYMPIINLKLFTLWSIRQLAERLTEDEHIFNAINVAEKYIHDLADIQDLDEVLMLLPTTKDPLPNFTRKQNSDWCNKRCIVGMIEKLIDMLITEESRVLSFTYFIDCIGRDFGRTYEETQLDYLVKYFKKDAQ